MNHRFDVTNGIKPVDQWRKEVWQAISCHGTVRRFQRRETIFAPGSPATGVYAVKSGLVSLGNFGSAGQAVTESLRGPGDFFGYAEVILNETRIRHVTVLADADIFWLDRDRFLEMLADRPDLVMAMLGSALDRNARVHERHTELLGRPASYRVMYVLWQLASNASVPHDLASRVVLPITHEDMGHFCGLSRQTVTVELGALQDAAVVELGSRCIAIRDLDALSGMLNAADAA